MAGDSQNMERSTLERKDRAELAAVAAALGLKVSSRAKKADIVTLILDAVAQPGTAPTEGAASAPTDAPSGVAEAPAAQAPGPEATADAVEPDADAAASAAADDDVDLDEVSPETDAGSDAERAEPGARPERSGSRESRDPREPAESNDATASEGETNDGGEQPDGESEGSGRSRRRRRRGRDRGTDLEAGPAGEIEGEPVEVAGLLDLRDDGYGFLRVSGFLPSRDDVYVSVKQCRQLGLRKGDHLTGLARPASHKEKNPALTRVETVNGMDPEAARNRPRFDDQTPVAPAEEIVLAGGAGDLTARLVGALAPIAKGQRGLVHTTPAAERAGVVAALAGAIEASNPDLQLIVLSIGDRPEDVTSVRRIIESGEVVASTFDRPADEHTAVAELTVEHAKRLVEYGHDVVILVDGLTPLARAFNATTAPGGRILPGGLDAAAVYPIRRFLGAARNLEEGGSLTIVATLLTDTGAQLDAAIAEELRGTANRELRVEADAASIPTLDVSLPVAGQQSLLDQITSVRA